MLKKIGVIFGGMSSENEVSVNSANSILKNLDGEKYEIYKIYIDIEGSWWKVKFNIAKDITRDVMFNEMIGFTQEELIKIMDNQEISKESEQQLLPIMKENYDGYAFCINPKQKIYNSNMCLYFLKEYVTYKEIPENLIDTNIASDYSKLGKMLELCKGEGRQEIIEKTALFTAFPVSEESAYIVLFHRGLALCVFERNEVACSVA